MPDGIDAIVKKLGEAKYRYGDVVKTNNGNEVVITGYEVDDSYPYLGKTVDGEFEYFCDEEIGEVLKPSPYFPQHADTPNPATKEPTQFKVNDRVVTLKRLGLLEADLVGIVVAVRATGLEVSFEDGTMGFYLNNELDAYLRPAKERSVIADDSDEDDENKKAESLDPTAEEAQQYFRNVKRTQLDWMEWEFLSGKGLAAKGIRHNYFIHPSCSLHIGSEYICSIRVKTEVKDIDGLKKIADDHNKDLFLAEINMVVDPGPEEAQQPTPLMLESRPDEPTSKELRIVWDTDTPGEWVAVVGELTLAMSVGVSPHFVGRVYQGGKIIHRITDKDGEKLLDSLTTFVADKL